MADELNTSDEKVSLARTQLPFKAEYCKTSRAKCKKCSESMEANSLKLAAMVKSRWHDGFDATFYHVKCFFQLKRPQSVAEIGHFESLKFEDQKLLEKAIESNGLSVLGVSVRAEEKKGKSAKGGEKTKKSRAKKRNKEEEEEEDGPVDAEEGAILVNYDDFLVEYAKSSRAKCVKCEQKIEKDSVRLGKLDYDGETAFRAGPVPRWHHVECFVMNMAELKFYGRVEKIKQFQELDEEDRRMLKKTVKPLKVKLEDTDIKKPKLVDPADLEEEKLLKEQSDRFFALREIVNTIKRKDIELMLEQMKQKSNFKNSGPLIDMATDVLLFGPLKKCPKCRKNRGIVLRNSSYICTTGHDGDNPCDYETRDPERDVPDIPDEIIEKYPFFSDEYEFTGGRRMFASKLLKAVEKKEAEDNNLVQDGAPLDGLSIGVVSWSGVKMDKVKVQKRVTTLGGRIQTALDSTIFVILSSEDQLAANEGPKMEVAKELGVPFAKVDFLFNIETKDDVLPQLKKNLIGDWDGDLEARFKEMFRKA